MNEVGVVKQKSLIVGVDPELSKTDNIKKEEERLRASIRRENQQRRTRERAHARHGLSASFLDDDDSIAAIKNKYKVHSYTAAHVHACSESVECRFEADTSPNFISNPSVRHQILPCEFNFDSAVNTFE